MKEKPTIYLLIPVYNAEEYIARCLESIKNQTYKNFVCVIVNDGSTDKSAEICKKYAEDARFILLSQENHGCWFARNTGLDYVLENAGENDFLTFADSDDTLDSHFFERFVSVLSDSENSKDTIYLSGYNEVFPQKTIVHNIEQQDAIISGNFREDFEKIDQFMQTIWANFYSISLIREKNLKFDSTMRRSGDIFFNFSYAYYVKNYVFINECFYNYYIVETSISHGASSLTNESIDVQYKALSQRIKFLTECAIPSKDFIINKHLSNLTTRLIFTPYYKRLYELKKYANPKFTRTTGQKRVIFCLKYNLLWVYRIYMKGKSLFRKS